MDLVVLIKQVPDPERNAGMKEDGTLDREGSKNILNPYDENALEAAISIKEKHGGKVVAISMGLPRANDVLKRALAMGADEAYLISDKALAGSDTLATAYALSKAIEKTGHYDIIFCGMQAIDGDTAQVGPQIAERLRIPQLTYVEDIVIENDEIEAKRVIEGGYEIVRTKYPALLTITNTANDPRYTSIFGIRKASKKEIPAWSVDYIEANKDKIGRSGSPTKVKKIERPESEKELKMFKDKDIGEMVTELVKTLKKDGVQVRGN